jgi:hypothetical protein
MEIYVEKKAYESTRQCTFFDLLQSCSLLQHLLSVALFVSRHYHETGSTVDGVALFYRPAAAAAWKLPSNQAGRVTVVAARFPVPLNPRPVNSYAWHGTKPSLGVRVLHWGTGVPKNFAIHINRRARPHSCVSASCSESLTCFICGYTDTPYIKKCTCRHRLITCYTVNQAWFCFTAG